MKIGIATPVVTTVWRPGDLVHPEGGHVFDISLHGFPEGMVKSGRKYWTREIADMITPAPGCAGFVVATFDVRTTFTRDDYTRVLVERFGLERARVEAFFGHWRA